MVAFPAEPGKSSTPGIKEVSHNCCVAVRRWRAIRRCAERNNWPFYVGFEDGDLLQYSLAASASDPSKASESHSPFEPIKIVRILQSSAYSLPNSDLSTINNEDPGDTRGIQNDSVVPLGSPAGIAAALAVSKSEMNALLGAAVDHLEQKRIRSAVDDGVVSRLGMIGVRLKANSCSVRLRSQISCVVMLVVCDVACICRKSDILRLPAIYQPRSLLH